LASETITTVKNVTDDERMSFNACLHFRRPISGAHPAWEGRGLYILRAVFKKKNKNKNENKTNKANWRFGDFAIYCLNKSTLLSQD